MGVQEWLVILIVALVVFGPGKLPEIGRSLGKSIAEVKLAISKSGQNGEVKKLAEVRGSGIRCIRPAYSLSANLDNG